MSLDVIPALLPPWHGLCAWPPRGGPLLLLLLTLPLSAAETSPASPPPSGRAAARIILRQTYAYDPSIRQQALAEAEAAPDVVRMDPVVVLESKTELQFTRYQTRAKARAEAAKPSLANGADVPGVPGLGVRPYEDLLAEDARFTTGAPDVARFTLLRIPW